VCLTDGSVVIFWCKKENSKALSSHFDSSRQFLLLHFNHLLFSVCGILTARKNNQMEVIDYAHDCQWMIMNLSVWGIWTQSDFTSGVMTDNLMCIVEVSLHCLLALCFFQYLTRQ